MIKYSLTLTLALACLNVQSAIITLADESGIFFRVTNEFPIMFDVPYTNILIAGSGITLTTNAGIVTITSTGGGGGGWPAVNSLASNIVFRSSDTNKTNVVLEQRIGQAVPIFSIMASNNTLPLFIDNAGYLNASNMPPPNRRPVTNNVTVFVDNGGGKMMLCWQDPQSNKWPVQPFSYRRVEIGPLTSTRFSSWGTSPITNGGTTVSHPVANEFVPSMVQVASGATSNNSASVAANIATVFSGTQKGHNGFWFTGEWAITNGIIHKGGGGIGVFIGLSDIATGSQTNMSTLTNNASTRYAGFAVHGQLGAGATNWHFITKDNSGSPETRIDLTLPLISSNLYRGWIHCPPQGRTIGFRIDDLTSGTTTSSYVTTTIPTNGLRLLATISNRTNISHSLRLSDLYLTPTAP